VRFRYQIALNPDSRVSNCGQSLSEASRNPVTTGEGADLWHSSPYQQGPTYSDPVDRGVRDKGAGDFATDRAFVIARDNRRQLALLAARFGGAFVRGLAFDTRVGELPSGRVTDPLGSIECV
jgi:hypothetical protein